MNDLQISKAKFEKKKEEIKKISNGISTEYKMDKFQTEDSVWFIKYDHKVTGSEMNSFTTVLQRYFSQAGENDREILKQFQKVYDTFDALDKEYIKGIVGSIKEIENVSNDTKDKLETISNDIKEKNDNVEEQIKSLLEAIVRNKDRLSSIDKINKEQDGRISIQEDINIEQEIALDRQRKKDEEHDHRLNLSEKRDSDQDRRLSDKDRIDKKHDKELARQAKKDEEHDLHIKDIESINESQDAMINYLKERVKALESTNTKMIKDCKRAIWKGAKKSRR